MMIRARHRSGRLGRQSGFVVCLALASLLSADWIAVIHGEDDPDDQAASVARPSALATSVSSASDAGRVPPEHCLICHWLRSLRSLAATGTVTSTGVASVGDVDALPSADAPSGAAVRIPARSPPA
jgi:hypothetical protein